MESSKLLVKRLNADATLPTRGSQYSAGLDLYASESVCISKHPLNKTPKFDLYIGVSYVSSSEKALDEPSKLVSTGISMVIPQGYYGRIAPRSGFSVKHGLIINAGVIDSDYRGEIKILFNNFTNSDVVIQKGDKIAQIIIEKIALLDVEEVDDLDNTERGDKGFGSTGY